MASPRVDSCGAEVDSISRADSSTANSILRALPPAALHSWQNRLSCRQPGGIENVHDENERRKYPCGLPQRALFSGTFPVIEDPASYEGQLHKPPTRWQNAPQVKTDAHGR